MGRGDDTGQRLWDICARPWDFRSSFLSLVPKDAYVHNLLHTTFSMEKCGLQVYTRQGVLKEYIHLCFLSLLVFSASLSSVKMLVKVKFPGTLSATFLNLMGQMPAYFLARVFSILLLFHSSSLRLFSSIEWDLAG